MRRRPLVILFATLALAAIGRQMTAQSGSNAALTRHADSLLSAKDYRAAAEAYTRLAASDTTSARTWTQLGMSSYQLGDYRAAAAAFAHASANGGGPTALYNVGAMYSRLNESDSAFAWLTRAVRAGFTDTTTLAHDEDINSLRPDPRFSALHAAVARAFAPCAVDSVFRRFDFWAGNWRVTAPGGYEVGRSQVQVVSGGCALLENWYASNGGQGKSLNTYDPNAHEWRQFWVGQTGLTDYVRSEWHDGTLTFYDRLSGAAGPQQRLSFTPVDANTVRQHGESSSDGGRTWTTTYDFLYHRAP